MGKVLQRRRGTAIVETNQGILLTGGRHAGQERPFILPGGGAERGESRLIAALRELTEETGLKPYYAEVIFRHPGKARPSMSGKGLYQDQHTVCFIKATGHPKPGGGDAKRISYYSPGCHVWISSTTKEIIERYYKWKATRNKVEDILIADDDGEDLGEVEDASSTDNFDDYDADEKSPNA